MTPTDAVPASGWLGTARSRAAQLLGHEAARGVALALGLKVTSSALNFAMLTLLARSLGVREFGVFAFWFSVLSFLAVTAGLGQEKLILRQWQEYHSQRDWGRAAGALRFGLATTILSTVLFAAGFLVAGSLANVSQTLVVAGSLYLLLLTPYTFTSHLNRAMIGIFRGDVNELTWRAVVIAGATLALLTNVKAGAAYILGLAALGVAIGLAIQSWSAISHLPDEVRRAAPRTERRQWALRSLRMAMGANLEAAGQYLEVVVVGLVLSPTMAAGYFVAARLANVFVMISTGLDSYTTRQIPRQHYSNGPSAVTATLRRIALLTIGPIVLGLIATFLFGETILRLFGNDFVDDYPVLVILSLGTAVVALAGPVMPVLVLTGHEGTYSLLLGINLAIRLAAIVAFAWAFGAVGAAAASALSSMAGAFALNVACRRQAGLDSALTVLLRKRGD